MKFITLLVIIIATLPTISSAQNIELINSGELIKMGVKAYDSGKYKKALSIYNEISRSDTNYVRSLYEKAMTCEADSQYKQGLKYCEEAFSLNEQREYEPDLYNVYGNTLHDYGQPEKALTVFDTAIAKYPSYALLYFNKAVVQMALNRYAKAEELFQKAIMINPYMYSAHYQLGIAALRQGKIIPAYLCFTGYLLVNPSGKYWSKSLNLLSQISKGTDEILDYKNKRTINPDENYQTVEDIVLSKIAFDKGYKPIIALDDQISRQIQAIFEKLEYSDNNSDFYVQYYFPYYKKIFTEGEFELFINHIFSNATVPIIQDYNKRNKKALDVFVNEAADYFNLIRATRKLPYKKRDQVSDRYYFENGKLTGKGVLTSGKTLTGNWEFYYPAGNIKGIGTYNAQGKREGDWKFYYTSGNLNAMEHYKGGKLEGEADNYYENGNLMSRELYVDNKLDGLATSCYYGGKLKFKGNYKQGKRDGEINEYYSNGNLHTVGDYVADVLTGTSKQYYKSGGIKETEEYVNGKAEGYFKSYHEGGNLSVTGQNTKDKGYGEWKYYYSNGKIKEKRNYVNDMEDGLHQEYFDNGGLSGTYIAKKGKINGEATNFYKDGTVLSKFVYNNGVISSAKFFDKAGLQLSASNLKNNLINIVSYDFNGFKKSHYCIDQKGDLTGPDTLFYPSGKISQISQYNKGELNGLLVSYYLNGNKKSTVNYTEGKENGYSMQYFNNGKIDYEGWILDGKDQGEWDNYDEKGRLTVKTFYLDNDLNGYKEEYLANGQLNIEQKFHHGWLEKLTQYDSLGKVLTVDAFPKATGKFILYHPNMKVLAQCNYINGDFDGFYTTYFFDGGLASKTFYKKGLQDSTFTSFYFGKTMETEGQYKGGNKIGLWKFYDEDGKLNSTRVYLDDQKNGPEIRFFPTGNKNQVSVYKDDELNGNYVKFAPDGTLAYQIDFEDGIAKTYSYLGKNGQLVPPVTIATENGILKAYFQNGNIARECTYSDGVKNGKDIMYYPNGQIWSAYTCSFSVFNGSYKEYYPDGKLKLYYPYKNDNLDGICREYNINGTLKKEEPYDNNMNHGLAKYFDPAGKPIKTMLYFFGTLTTVKNEK